MFAGKDVANMTLMDFNDELNSRGDFQSSRGRRWISPVGKEDYIR